MKRSLFIATILLACAKAWGQNVFFEGFDETANSTTGTENSGGGVTWSTTCPGSIATSDYFKVVGGKLEAKDTNGPEATWTTGSIDVSTCIGLAISFDLEEVDDLEACADCGGTGTDCVDWVKLEYNLDGGGWTEIAGTTCPATMTVAPGELIFTGDLTPDGGPVTYTSPCIDFGSTLQVRISCMCWAGAEEWQFDNISVDCNNCVLSVEFNEFDARAKGDHVLLEWETASETDNDYFVIERSIDAQNFVGIGTQKGQGNSIVDVDYRFVDDELLDNGIVYYRLRQIDFSGEAHFSKIRSVQIRNNEVRYVDGRIQLMTYDNAATKFTLNVYDLGGRLVHSQIVGNASSIPWTKSGFYLVDIPELNVRQKIAVP